MGKNVEEKEGVEGKSPSKTLVKMKAEKKVVPWDQIREAYLAGVMNLRQLALAFGVGYEAVKSRKHREKWGEPAELVELKDIEKVLKEKGLDQIPVPKTAKEITKIKSEKVEELSLYEKGVKFQHMMADKALEVAAYIKGLPPDKVLSKAVAIEKFNNMAHKNLGLDKTTPQGVNGNLVLNLQFLQMSDPLKAKEAKGTVVVEAQAVSVEG